MDDAFDDAANEVFPLVRTPARPSFAIVATFAIVSAKDPATPTVPPDAPDVASDENGHTIVCGYYDYVGGAWSGGPPEVWAYRYYDAIPADYDNLVKTL